MIKSCYRSAVFKAEVKEWRTVAQYFLQRGEKRLSEMIEAGITRCTAWAKNPYSLGWASTSDIEVLIITLRFQGGSIAKIDQLIQDGEWDD